MRESRGLMGLPAPRVGYDGVVQVGMTQVRVQDGMLQMGQRRFFVEDDGEVLDERERPIARVKDGKMVPLNKESQGGANGIKQ